MNKPTVYVETTIIGHIASRPHPDVVVAARQISSRQWWDQKDKYELFISQIVIDECSFGDATAAAERLNVLQGISKLDVKPEVAILSKRLIANYAIPAAEPRDALHIAVAAVNGLQYLLTWNFRHIANASTRSLIEKICLDVGHSPPTICSPDELMGV